MHLKMTTNTECSGESCTQWKKQVTMQITTKDQLLCVNETGYRRRPSDLVLTCVLNDHKWADKCTGDALGVH